MNILPNEEKHSKRWLNHLSRAVLLGLCLLSPNYIFTYLTCPVQRPMWSFTTLLMGGHPLPFDPTFSSCVLWEVSLTLRMINTWSLYLLSQQHSAPPCSHHYLCLGVSVYRRQIQLLSLGPIHFLPHEKKQ